MKSQYASSAKSQYASKGEPDDLRFPVNLGPPPADADKKKTPVLEEFRWLAFEGMADELENPSHDEQTEGVWPEWMEEDAGEKK